MTKRGEMPDFEFLKKRNERRAEIAKREAEIAKREAELLKDVAATEAHLHELYGRLAELGSAEASVLSTAREGSYKARIIEYARVHSGDQLSAKAIAEELGISPRTVYGTLDRAFREGTLVKTHNGAYFYNSPETKIGGWSVSTSEALQQTNEESSEVSSANSKK